MTEVSLCAIGDIMLGDSPVCYGFGVGTVIEKYGPFYPFQQVAEELKQADIVFGNLEVVLSAHDKKKDTFDSIQFRGQPGAARGLVEANVSVVSLATNHTMQHGRRALEETVDILKKHRIDLVGIEIPEKHIANRCLVERKGLKFMFLGYNFRPQQYFIDPPLWQEPHYEMIKNDLDKFRKEVDYIIVSIHWGDEFIDYPSPFQVDLAHKLIDGGADVILGHHPHICQGIEKYNGGIVAYSLGNFVFDMWQYRLRKTMILKCFFTKELGLDYQVVPAVINKHHQPEIIRGQAGEKLIKEIEGLSRKISNSQGGMANYNRELKRNLKRFRREIYRYYLTHLPRYNFRYLFANFLSAMKKRLLK